MRPESKGQVHITAARRIALVTFARAAFLATSHSCSLRQTYLVGSDDCSCDNRKAAFGAQLTLSESRLSDGFAPKAAA